MRYFPHIPRTVRTGTYSSTTHPSRSSRCPELASSYCLCLIGLSLPVLPPPVYFCPSLARRSSLPAAPACPPLQPARRSARRSACSACSACSAALPLCRSACSSPPACKKSETLKSLAFLLSGLGLRQPPPDFLRVSPENLPGRAARGSWPNRPRDVSLRR